MEMPILPHPRAVARTAAAAARIALVATCLFDTGLAVAAPAHGDAAAEPLQSIAEILVLPIEEFERRRPVIIQGVVTLCQPLVIQNGEDAIYLDHTTLPLATGQRWQDIVKSLPVELGTEVEVTGIVDPGGYAPWVAMHEIRRLGKQSLPAPVPLDVAQLFTGQGVGRRVRITGVVQGVLEHQKRWLLAFESASRRFSVTIAKSSMPQRPDGLIDSEVEVVGVGKTFRNTRGEFVAPGLYLAQSEDLRVIRPPRLGPFELPVTPLGSIARYRVQPLGGHRVRTSGIVSFVAPGTLFLQDGIGGVEVVLAPLVDGESVFEPGDHVDVAGFLDMTSGIGAVTWAVARKIARGASPLPLRIQPREILRVNQEYARAGSVARPGSYDGCLIRCQGKLDAVNRGSDETLLTLTDEGTAFNARMANRSATDPMPFVLGSELELTGIVQAERHPAGEVDTVRGSTTLSQVRLLVRDRTDIRVLRVPPWWTPGRLAVAAGVLGLLAAASTVWVTFLRREVARQTARAIAEESARQQAALDYEITLRERNQLAGNLHDTALQTVTGIAFQLKVCEAKERGRFIEDGDIAVDDEVSRHLGVARKMVEHAADQLRGTVWSLRSLPNEGRSFSDALHELIARLETGHEARVRLAFDSRADAIPAYVAGNLILVIQEAVHNALHHADPRLIDVTINLDAAGGVTITIRDDGVGFEVGRQAGPRQGHFGLAGMRERVERLDGMLEITSTPGRGTTVRAVVPPEQAQPAKARRMYE